MSYGQDGADRLAYALTETEFDAVEQDGLRAEWTGDGTRVVVRPVDDGEEVRYSADDLVRATSDPEVNNARLGPDEQ
ncbi:MAG: hypothetical protein ABEJ23_01635 [Haloarculaceae archaeon]